MAVAVSAVEGVLAHVNTSPAQLATEVSWAPAHEGFALVRLLRAEFTLFYVSSMPEEFVTRWLDAQSAPPASGIVTPAGEADRDRLERLKEIISGGTMITLFIDADARVAERAYDELGIGVLVARWPRIRKTWQPVKHKAPPAWANRRR